MSRLVGITFLLVALASVTHADNSVLRSMLGRSSDVLVLMPLKIEGGDMDEAGVEEWTALCTINTVIKGKMKKEGQIIVHFNRFDFKKHREMMKFQKGKPCIVFLNGKAGASTMESGKDPVPVYRLLDRWFGVMPYDWHLANTLNPDVKYEDKVQQPPERDK